MLILRQKPKILYPPFENSTTCIAITLIQNLKTVMENIETFLMAALLKKQNALKSKSLKIDIIKYLMLNKG